MIKETEVVVLGSGPGGYTAAFRAADLGLKTIVIERKPTLGGVCLNEGCIPSKALLHIAKVIDEASQMGGLGVAFGKPAINLDKIRAWKDNEVVGKLTSGLKMLAKQRKVEVVEGEGRFISKHEIEVSNSKGEKQIVKFQHAIIAVGS